MLSDLNMQMVNIKLQLNSMQSQFENIQNQMQNMGITFIGSQMQNLGIQMINNGMQVLNIGMKLPNMNNNDNLNIKNQIENIKMQIQNFEMNFLNMNDEIQNMPMQMPNNFGMMGMMMPNMEMFNNDFNNPLNNNLKQEFNNDNFQKMNVLFETLGGIRINLVLNKGTTIDEALKTFLKRFGKPELIDTKDKIFLLSQLEMIDADLGFSEEYETADENRRCAPTIYAVARGLYAYTGTDAKYQTKSGEGTCSWWLRSPGQKGDSVGAYAAVVGRDGNVYAGGTYVWSDYNSYASYHYDRVGVRPAMVIKLK